MDLIYFLSFFGGVAWIIAIWGAIDLIRHPDTAE